MPEIVTVRDHIAWSYANLARAHAAVSAGATRYAQVHHIVRSRLYKGLRTEAMSLGSLYDDERVKLEAPRACVYCGSRTRLSLDHLIPRLAGGSDEADNLVAACRSCNSAKGGRDMLEWMTARGRFPSLLVLRRYLKIVARRCADLGLMEAPLAGVAREGLPFAIDLLPHEFPPLGTLRLWVEAEPEAEPASIAAHG